MTVSPEPAAAMQPEDLGTFFIERANAGDVDGLVAEQRGMTPVFTAPPLNSTGPYGSGAYWFPGLRHNGTGNFAFIDGSVSASSDPLGEQNWDWAYQPVR